jgi:hypothetical protein
MAPAVTDPSAYLAFVAVLESIDKMTAAAGAVLTAQPAEMTRRAEALHDARLELQKSVQHHGRIVMAALAPVKR